MADSMRSAFLAWGALVVVMLSSGCSDDEPAGAGGNATGGGGTGGAGAGGGGTGTAGGSGGDGGGGSGGAELTPAQVCVPGCTTPDDCSSGVAAFDADNYTCEAGQCVYQGCNSDAECEEQGPRACRLDPMGSQLMVCLQTCTTASSCANGATNPEFDADNWSCDQGVCVYLGCNDDSECVLQENGVCRPAADGLDHCVESCTTPADCDQGNANLDADNFACVDGACRYTGCNNDDECAEALQAGFVCGDP